MLRNDVCFADFFLWYGAAWLLHLLGQKAASVPVFGALRQQLACAGMLAGSLVISLHRALTHGWRSARLQALLGSRV